MHYLISHKQYEIRATESINWRFQSTGKPPTEIRAQLGTGFIFKLKDTPTEFANAPPTPAPRHPFVSTPVGAGDKNTAPLSFGRTGDRTVLSTQPPVLRDSSQGPGTGGHGGHKALRTAERPGFLDAPVTWPVCVTFSPVDAMRTPKHLTLRGRLSAATPLRPSCLQKVTAAAILQADP